MARKICVAIQKGGTSKTTTTVNLGIGLAKRGYKVLLVDFDPQGSLTASLGCQEPDDLENTIVNKLTELCKTDTVKEPLADILTHEEGVDYIPGNVELSALEISLVNIMGRESVLKDYLSMIDSFYDFILIDCGPSLGILTINALVAADEVLIPVNAEFLSAKGLQIFTDTIRKIRRKLNRHLKINGIILTKTESNSRDYREVEKKIIETFGENNRIYETRIPKAVKIKEAPKYGVSIYRHAPNSKAAKAYEALVEEFLNEEKSGI